MKGFKKKEWMVPGLEVALALLLIFGYKSAVTEKVGTWSGKVESSVSEKKTGIKDGKKKGQREKTGKEEKGEEGEELQEKKIAITFDDGPHPVYTEELLDGLKEREVKATFFVLGQNVEKYPEIIERMKEE